MSTIEADFEACQGYGNCVVGAPAYFDLNDDGVVVVLSDQVAESDHAQVETAVRSCPVSALRLA